MMHDDLPGAADRNTVRPGQSQVDITAKRDTAEAIGAGGRAGDGYAPEKDVIDHDRLGRGIVQHLAYEIGNRPEIHGDSTRGIRQLKGIGSGAVTV